MTGPAAGLGNHEEPHHAFRRPPGPTRPLRRPAHGTLPGAFGLRSTARAGEILGNAAARRHDVPLFTRLADALRNVGPLVDKLEGWSPEVGRALCFIAKEFEASTETWGWGPLAEPSPNRDAHEKACREKFKADVEGPYYDAVMSIDAGWPSVRSPYAAEAEKGRRLGISPR